MNRNHIIQMDWADGNTSDEDRGQKVVSLDSSGGIVVGNGSVIGVAEHGRLGATTNVVTSGVVKAHSAKTITSGTCGVNGTGYIINTGSTFKVVKVISQPTFSGTWPNRILVTPGVLEVFV